MITAEFCADADHSLSMVTHHQVLHGVATLEQQISEMHELYSYISIVSNDEMYLTVKGYSLRIRVLGYRDIEVYISSNNDFGTFKCISCSIIITPHEVCLKLQESESVRYSKRLLLK